MFTELRDSLFQSSSRDLDELLIDFASHISSVLLPLVPTKDDCPDLMTQTVVDDYPSGFVNGIPHLTVALFGDCRQLFRPKPLGLTFFESGDPFVVPLIFGLQLPPINNKAGSNIANAGQPVIDAVVTGESYIHVLTGGDIFLRRNILVE